MKDLVFQSCVVLFVSVFGALGTWMIAGGPEALPEGSQELLQPGEVCLKTAEVDWGDLTVAWIDARPRRAFDQSRYPGAVLLNRDPKEDFDAMLADAFESIATADHVIVYCAKAGCKASREVADAILETGMTENVHTLWGGIRTLEAAERLEN